MAFDNDDVVLAARIKALGHPARLAIVRALIRISGSRCCGEIVQDLPLAQSTVSQHLKVLRDAGIVRGEVDGSRSCYCVDRAALAAIVEAMGGFTAISADCGCADEACAEAVT
ncbi:ArsR/SmtB family transcription factor [Bauldia sp.]|uniref:ArsR/SmtB family transcription factor n=1 Tax=Bauldia sp. TaxID=2575872 RepID=UPI003BAABF06